MIIHPRLWAVVVVVGALILSVVVIPDNAAADTTTTWTTDTDWQSGTIDAGLQLVGTGVPSYLTMKKGTIPNWMKMAPSTIPPKRDAYCMVWIDVDNSFLLFGGYGSGTRLNDTWKYNFTQDQWTQISTPNAPSARSRHTCAYDSDQKVVVLYGGIDNTGTWIYDTWQVRIMLSSEGVPPT